MRQMYAEAGRHKCAECGGPVSDAVAESLALLEDLSVMTPAQAEIRIKQRRADMTRDELVAILAQHATDLGLPAEANYLRGLA